MAHGQEGTTQTQLQENNEETCSKRRQHTKSLEDYMEHNPAIFVRVSPASSGVSDSCECDQPDKATNAELYQVLEELHKCDKLPSVSHWNTPDNDAALRKYFKMTRRLVTPDDFILSYFWAGEQLLYEQWQKSREVRSILKFVEMSTAAVDITEIKLFLPAEISPDKNRENFSDYIWQHAKKILRSHSLQRLLDFDDSPESLHEM